MPADPHRDPRTDPLLRDLPEQDGKKILDGRYVLLDTLGSGGMGVVYLARHAVLEQDVAIKCLDPGLARRDSQFVERFRKEARAAARVQHENVVRVVDVAETDGLHYLVMECVRGDDARKHVRRSGGLTIESARAIATGAARGLCAAHEAGLIHRDVKPDNILIAEDGSAKVADLGLAKAVDSSSMLTQSGVVLGTPVYMPPEQFDDPRGVGAPADIYSFGATLFFLLTGTEAIHPGSYHEVRDRIENRAFPDPRSLRPETPEPLALLVLDCTRKDPADRPPNMGVIVRRLEAAGAAAPGASPSPPGSPAGGDPRRGSSGPLRGRGTRDRAGGPARRIAPQKDNGRRPKAHPRYVRCKWCDTKLKMPDAALAGELPKRSFVRCPSCGKPTPSRRSSSGTSTKPQFVQIADRETWKSKLYAAVLILMVAIFLAALLIFL